MGLFRPTLPGGGGIVNISLKVRGQCRDSVSEDMCRVQDMWPHTGEAAEAETRKGEPSAVASWLFVEPVSRHPVT